MQMRGDIDLSQFVHISEGCGFKRSIEAESMSDLARRLELGVNCDASGEQTESEKLINLFDKSAISVARANVEKGLAQLTSLLNAPFEYNSSAAQRAVEAEQQRQKKERQMKKKVKQAETEAKNNANKLAGGKRPAAMSGALALQAKLQADPVAMEKFLKEVDEAKRKERERQQEEVRRERAKYKEQLANSDIERGPTGDNQMPLRLQNVVALNIKSVNSGSLSKESTLSKRKMNSLKLVKRQIKARDTRDTEEIELAKKADILREQFSQEKVRAINTPVRKQFELAASLFLTATIWRCANTCIEEHESRKQRDLEYRAVFILQRHFRETLRILHLRQKNHALIIIRNAMMSRLLLRRYRDKEQATEKLKLLAEDIEMREKVAAATKIFYNKILVVQRFAKRLYVVSQAQRQMIVNLLLDAEGDVINESVCSDLQAKAKIKYEREMKEWKDLRKINRSKADKMGAPVLAKPDRQKEEVLAPLRMHIDNLTTTAMIIFKQRIKLKSWDDSVRLFFIPPDNATRIVQSIRTALKSGSTPESSVLEAMAK